MGDTGFTINSKVYNFFKWIALVVLPALATLVLTLGISLNWSTASIAAGVITAFDTFLGAILKSSSSNYAAKQNVGDWVVLQDPEGAPVGMKIVGNKENPVFKDGDQVSLTVRREPAPPPVA
jgi:hypothetical protein